MIEVLGQPSGPQSIRAHMPVFDASAPMPFEKANSPSSGSSPPAPSPRPPKSTTSASGSARPLIPSSSTTTTTAGPSVDPFSLDETTAQPHTHGLGSTQVAVDFVSHTSNRDLAASHAPLFQLTHLGPRPRTALSPPPHPPHRYRRVVSSSHRPPTHAPGPHHGASSTVQLHHATYTTQPAPSRLRGSPDHTPRLDMVRPCHLPPKATPIQLQPRPTGRSDTSPVLAADTRTQ